MSDVQSLQYGGGKLQLVMSQFIPRLFPSMNEVLRARARDPKFGWSNIKTACQNAVEKALESRKLLPPEPYHIVMIWYEYNKARDPDNIVSGGSKPLLDALQKCNVISDDGWEYVGRLVHEFAIAETEDEVGVVIQFWHDPALVASRKEMLVPKGRTTRVPRDVRIVKPVQNKTKKARGKSRRLGWKKKKS